MTGLHALVSSHHLSDIPKSRIEMSGREHHRALKTEVVDRLNAGRAQMVLGALQSGKRDKWFTLHVNPTSFSTAGLQPTDWLAYLGFRRNDQCNFTESQRCYSREVPQEFDLQQFATAFNAGFGYLEKRKMGFAVFCCRGPKDGDFTSAGAEAQRDVITQSPATAIRP
jgi:hypothetical protein